MPKPRELLAENTGSDDVFIPEFSDNEPPQDPIEEKQMRRLVSRTVEKSKGGRPPGSRNKVASKTESLLPRPPNFRMKPAVFFKYWDSLKAKREWIDNTMVYVYRMWPVINLQIEDEGAEKNIGKIVDPFSPDNWMGEILHRFGSGDYKLMLRDESIRKACGITHVMGLRDEDYPPVVDPATVVMDDPSNQSYLAKLRSKGVRLPGDYGYEGEEGMAETKEIVQNVLAQNAQLTERVISMAQRGEQKQDAVDRQKADEDKKQESGDRGDAISRSLSLITAASEMANKLVDKAISRVNDVQSAQSDPTAMMHTILETAERISKPAHAESAANMTLVQRLIEQNEQLQKTIQSARDKELGDRLTSLENMLVRIANPQMAGYPAPLPGQTGPLNPPPPGAMIGGQQYAQPQPPSSMLDKLGELTKLRQAFEDLGFTPEKETSGGGWEKYIPMLMTGLSIVVPAISNAFYNAAVSRVGQGVPIAPPSPPPPSSMPTAEEEDQQTQAQYQEQPQPGQGASMNPYGGFLAKIEKPLLTHLRQNATGGDFADWLIRSDDNGQLIYEALCEQGKEAVLRMLSMYPPIWSMVQGIPAKFDAFLDEFLQAYDAAGDPGEAPVGDGTHNVPTHTVHPVDASGSAIPEVIPPLNQPRTGRKAR